MEYLLIKNIPIAALIDRKSGGGMKWVNFGFNANQITRLCAQGDDGSGNFLSLIPINDLDKLNSKWDYLQNKVDTNGIEDDSIEIVDEDSDEYIEAKALIEAARGN